MIYNIKNSICNTQIRIVNYNTYITPILPIYRKGFGEMTFIIFEFQFFQVHPGTQRGN